MPGGSLADGWAVLSLVARAWRTVVPDLVLIATRSPLFVQAKHVTSEDSRF